MYSSVIQEHRIISNNCAQQSYYTVYSLASTYAVKPSYAWYYREAFVRKFTVHAREITVLSISWRHQPGSNPSGHASISSCHAESSLHLNLMFRVNKPTSARASSVRSP